MRFRHATMCVLVVLGLFASPAIAWAVPMWSWEFAETHYTVDPDDAIVVEVTLINSPLSTESITEHGGASFTGDLQNVYAFSWGTTGIYGEDLVGLDVAPGESFTFVLGVLTPIGGAAPIGVHPFCCEAHLTFGNETGLTTEAPQNTFQIEVVEVAEPPLALLVAIGMVLLVVARR
jgi:hypothetical protein